MTFNWAVLVAYAAKTGAISPAVCILYAGLIFWTIGYDTIYACQDIEDDMKVGNKSTAIRFGKWVKLGVSLSYLASVLLITKATECSFRIDEPLPEGSYTVDISFIFWYLIYLFMVSLFAAHLLYQSVKFDSSSSQKSLKLFKSNFWAGIILTVSFVFFGSYQ